MPRYCSWTCLKPFDTVHRHHILEDLRSILDADELHLIKVLIEDVTIAVKIKEKTGKSFVTNIGTPQGDCLSPILFTLYLAKALQENLQPSHRDHAYASLLRPTDHNYSKPDTSKEGFLISLQSCRLKGKPRTEKGNTRKFEGQKRLTRTYGRQA